MTSTASAASTRTMGTSVTASAPSLGVRSGATRRRAAVRMANPSSPLTMLPRSEARDPVELVAADGPAGGPHTTVPSLAAADQRDQLQQRCGGDRHQRNGRERVRQRRPSSAQRQGENPIPRCSRPDDPRDGRRPPWSRRGRSRDRHLAEDVAARRPSDSWPGVGTAAAQSHSGCAVRCACASDSRGLELDDDPVDGSLGDAYGITDPRRRIWGRERRTATPARDSSEGPTGGESRSDKSNLEEIVMLCWADRTGAPMPHYNASCRTRLQVSAVPDEAGVPALAAAQCWNRSRTSATSSGLPRSRA